MNSSATTAVSGAPTGLALSENSMKVLAKRYLKRNEDGAAIETAEDMFRPCWTIADGDAARKSAPRSSGPPTVLWLMTSLDFTASDPRNAGREQDNFPPVSLPVGDSWRRSSRRWHAA
jgi:ribonucleoside-diphosphate reductase alpha chain